MIAATYLPTPLPLFSIADKGQARKPRSFGKGDIMAHAHDAVPTLLNPHANAVLFGRILISQLFRYHTLGAQDRRGEKAFA